MSQRYMRYVVLVMLAGCGNGGGDESENPNKVRGGDSLVASAAIVRSPGTLGGGVSPLSVADDAVGLRILAGVCQVASAFNEEEWQHQGRAVCNLAVLKTYRVDTGVRVCIEYITATRDKGGKGRFRIDHPPAPQASLFDVLQNPSDGDFMVSRVILEEDGVGWKAADTDQWVIGWPKGPVEDLLTCTWDWDGPPSGTAFGAWLRAGGRPRDWRPAGNAVNDAPFTTDGMATPQGSP